MGLKDLFKKKETTNVINTRVDDLQAYLSGRLIPIEEVKDEMFASKVLGDGVAIEPTSNTVLSPIDGKIAMVTEDSLHACGIQAGGLQLLIHIGIDTVTMNGEGFTCHVKVGDEVKKGDKLITFDAEKIKEMGFERTTMLIIAENKENIEINFLENIEVVAGETKINI